jgi:GPH family glycoside/pentoside/hexuronide:cation symporter
MEPSQPRIPVGERIAYGLGDTATNLVWRTLMVFLGFFYTDVFGLPAAAVGTLMLLSRFGDGISDVVIGVLADRTQTRWGKFRPWILWMALPFGILTVLTFTTPDLGPTGKLVYAYITYNALLIVFTASNIPYSAMTGVMSSDPLQRTLLSSYRFVGAFLGALLTQGLNDILVQRFGGGDDVIGYKYTMMLFAGVAVVLFLITFAGTKERVEAPPRQKGQMRKDFLDLFHNRAWLILFGVGLTLVTLTTLKQGSTMYYFIYYMDAKSLAAAYMIVGTLGAMLGAALTGLMTRQWGNRRVIQASFILAGVSSLAMFGVQGDDIYLIFILGFLTEFATGPIITLFFSMLADAADYSEWKTHRRATGLIYSAGTVSIKFGSGIGGAVTWWILALTGYVANETQSAEALGGIRFLMSIGPALAAVVGLALFYFYPIGPTLLREIREALEARHDKSSKTAP